jgi:hypothetical protein
MRENRRSCQAPSDKKRSILTQLAVRSRLLDTNVKFIYGEVWS